MGECVLEAVGVVVANATGCRESRESHNHTHSPTKRHTHTQTNSQGSKCNPTYSHKFIILITSIYGVAPSELLYNTQTAYLTIRHTGASDEPCLIAVITRVQADNGLVKLFVKQHKGIIPPLVVMVLTVLIHEHSVTLVLDDGLIGIY